MASPARQQLFSASMTRKWNSGTSRVALQREQEVQFDIVHLAVGEQLLAEDVHLAGVDAAVGQEERLRGLLPVRHDRTLRSGSHRLVVKRLELGADAVGQLLQFAQP